MINGLKPYPAIKESGVVWLGDVPAHWQVRRLGQIGNFSKGRGGNKDDEVPAGIPCVRYGDLYTTHEHFIEQSRSFVSSEKAGEYTPIKYGDVLFAASGETIEEIGKSAVNLIDSEARCGGDVILFRPYRRMEARYLGYATDCQPVATQKAIMGRGITVIHIYTDQLKRLGVSLPPLPEQAAIVRFLDHVDRRIRRYIRAKEKLIALLEEQKQSIIHQAVTGRIDVRTGQPYPAYKPSGVEWLGEVPAHWEVLPLCAVGKPKSVTDQQHRELLSVYLDRGVIRFSEVQEKRTNVTSEDLSKYQAVDPGDFVLNNQQAWRGSVGVSFLSGIVSPAYLVLSLDSKLLASYTNLVFRERVMVAQYLLCSRGVGSIQRNLYWPQLKRVTLTLPPLSEQTAIVRFLKETAVAIDDGVARAQREIDLLREYRTRLIADVVTGKLDVREATAALPEVDPLADDDEADDPLGADDESAFDDEDRPEEVAG